MPSQSRAVFLDRDGVLNKPIVQMGKPYPPSTVEEFEILPGVPEALAVLRALGLKLFVVTNQPDVARGTQQQSTIEAMHAKIQAAAPVDGFYVCYHDDSDGCDCRKPEPGLLIQAAREHGILLSESFMVGDRWRDVDCGQAVECTTLFIERGYNELLRKQPNFTVPDLLSASRIISQIQGDKK